MRLSAKQLAAAYVETTEGKTGKALETSAKQFLDFLTGRNETHRIRDILRQVETVWKERYGAAAITIESAHPLSREARKTLEAAAHGATLRDVITPELIGGARLRIDDRVIDGSLSGQIERLKESLML